MPEYIYYKIVCKDENIKDCYVGKTTNFKRRIWNHKSDCYNQSRKCYNLNLYKFIRENGGINNWNFIEIEKGEYDNKDSAFRERYWFENLNATLNSVIPSRTKKENNKEYSKNNKEILKEYQNEYRKNNKEILKEYQNEYRKNNKEYQIEYYENNKEYFKEYYENNKDIINKKIICKCGCKINKNNLLRHLKTQKHIKFIALTADII
jgi:hypothetical protein